MWPAFNCEVYQQDGFFSKEELKPAAVETHTGIQAPSLQLCLQGPEERHTRATDAVELEGGVAISKLQEGQQQQVNLLVGLQSANK